MEAYSHVESLNDLATNLILISGVTYARQEKLSNFLLFMKIFAADSCIEIYNKYITKKKNCSIAKRKLYLGPMGLPAILYR